MLAFAGICRPAVAVEPISVDEFNKRYKTEVAPLISAYAQVSIVATQTDRSTRAKSPENIREDVRHLSYFKDNDNEKLLSRSKSGEEDIRVARPEYSFVAERSPDKPFVIKGVLAQETRYRSALKSINYGARYI